MNNLSSNNSNKNDSFITYTHSINKKNTIENDNVLTREISNSSQDKVLGSDNKKSVNTENMTKNDIFSNNNKTLEGSSNKNNFLKNSASEENPKFSPNKHNSHLSIEEIKSSFNNSRNLKKNRMIVNAKLITDYKNWKGDNYFPFKAQIIEGPCSFRPTLITACGITVPTILFFIFNSKYLSDELTVFIPIIIAIIYLICFIYLIIASFRDPGIIRRYDIKKDDKSKDFIRSSTFNEFRRNEAKIFHLGYIKSFKFCPSCAIIRPCRSTHCSDCNNCVERLDHHCPWMGNCAGKRNYIYFFIFLILINILTILFIIFCVMHIIYKVKDYKDLNDKLNEENKINHLTAHSFCDVIISLYLIIYCIITMCFITGLIFYHCRLIIINSTTKEELKKLFHNCQGNPYRRNTCKNISNVLCIKKKKYSILDILRGDIREICDKNNNSYDKTKANDIDFGNETKIKLNIDRTILNNLNEEPNYKKNFTEQNGDSPDLKNSDIKCEKNNDFTESSLMKEPQDTENIIRRSNSFQMKNIKLEQYLKNFGTGISSNINKD